MMPAVATAKADAGNEVLATPIPAGAVPAVVVPAIIAAKPNELRALYDIQVISRTENCLGCNHWCCASAHDRNDSNKGGCGRDGNGESTHDDLPFSLWNAFDNARETTFAQWRYRAITVKLDQAASDDRPARVPRASRQRPHHD
jgi:hypothetical protein